MKIVTLDGKKLPLKNDGSLDIFFLGVGSMRSLKHNQTNFLLIKGDTHVLVDFGCTGLKALDKTAKLTDLDIEVVLPTHSHDDHVGGIGTLAIGNRYVGQPFMNKPKTKMIITEEYQRILWSQLCGNLMYNEELEGRPLWFGDYFDVIRPTWISHQPREVFEVRIGGLNIEIFRTKHIPDNSTNWQASFLSYGLYVDNRVFLSCDTRFDPELIDMYAYRSEVLFHDCQFFKGGVHASLEELRELPPEITKKMILKHYGDNYKEQDLSGFHGLAQQGVVYRFE